MPEFVEIAHPDIAATALVAETAVSHWSSAGWQPVHTTTVTPADDVQLVEHGPGTN